MVRAAIGQRVHVQCGAIKRAGHGAGGSLQTYEKVDSSGRLFGVGGPGVLERLVTRQSTVSVVVASGQKSSGASCG